MSNTDPSRSITPWRHRAPTALEVEEHAKAHPRRRGLESADPSVISGLWMVRGLDASVASFVELGPEWPGFTHVGREAVFYTAVTVHPWHDVGTLDELAAVVSEWRPCTADFDPCAWPDPVAWIRAAHAREMGKPNHCTSTKHLHRERLEAEGREVFQFTRPEVRRFGVGADGGWYYWLAEHGFDSDTAESVHFEDGTLMLGAWPKVTALSVARVAGEA